MPYRDPIVPTLACYRHTAAKAEHACGSCGQRVCLICVSFERAVPRCPDCAQLFLAQARRRTFWRDLAIGLSVVLFLVAARQMILAAPYNHGSDQLEIDALELELAREPCDVQKQLRLVALLEASHDLVGANARWRGFARSCPSQAAAFGHGE